MLPANGPALDCNGTVCRGEEVVYSTSNACNNFQWTVAGGQILSGGGPGDPSATVLWNGGPDGSISLTGLDCSPDLCPLPTVFEIPIIADDAEIEGDSRICEAEETAYEITAFGGSNYVWKLETGGQIVSGQGSPRIFVKWTAAPNTTATHWLSVVYDNCYLNCGGRDSLAVRILPKFKITGPLEVCENSVANFSGKTVPQNQPIALNWKVFDTDKTPVFSASNATKTNVLWNFGPGQFQVVGSVANPLLSCTDEAALTVQVYAEPPPLAGISGDTLICKNNPILYEAEGVSLAHAVFWAAVGGSWVSKIGESVPISWTGQASAGFKLWAWQRAPGGPGCNSDSTFLFVKPLPPAVINGPTTVCEGEIAHFSMDLPPYLTSIWSVSPNGGGQIIKGQGEAAAQIFFPKAGVFWVVVSRCGLSSQVTVTVVPKPKPAVLHPEKLCVGSETTVSTTAVFDSYSWRKENGAVISTAATASLGPGFYLLKVTDQFGCAGDTIFEMEPLPVPAATISTPGLLIVGAGNAIDIIATTTTEGLDYEWFKDSLPVGTNSPMLSTTSGGSYFVIVTDVRGCTAQSNILTPKWLQILTGNDPAPPCPNIGFTASGTATCNTRHYEAQLAPGWLAVDWAFSNGQTASGPSVDVVHPVAGFFQMYMVVTYPTGVCGLLDADHVSVAAKFDAPPECASDATKFRDLTTFLPGESISNWAWNFDDPTSGGLNFSTDKDPSHLFSALGLHQISLVVTAASGCTSVFSKAVGIQPPPAVQIITPTVGCAKTAIEFIGSTAAANAATWNWKIATGTPLQPFFSTSGNPAYYNYGVNFNFSSLVELKMTTIKGCESTATTTINITPNPLAGSLAVNPPSGQICLGQIATLTAPAGGTAWAWSGPGGPAIVSTDKALTTGLAGNYSVTMTNAAGCTLEKQQLISVLPAPLGVVKYLDFDTLGNAIGLFASPVDLCEGENVLLVGQGIEANYTWNWSNGNTGTTNLLDSTHGNLPPPGNHIFTVTLTASNGCTAITPPFLLNIHPNPSPVFIESSPAGQLCGHNGEVTFLVKNPDFDLSYLWNTGQPGAFFQTAEAGHFFAVARTPFGCETRSNSLEIRPGAPVFAVPAGCHQRCGADTICLDLPPGVVAWQWFFNGSPIANPLGQILDLPVSESGDYSLFLTDADGCTAFAGPVSIDLAAPFGDVLGEVFSDVNLNGILDAADTLVANIPVLLKDGAAVVNASLSGIYGEFLFENIASKGWIISLDSANLPSGWQPIIGSATVVLAGCDSQNSGSLLVQFCQPTTGKIALTTCPGEPVFYENQWLTAGSQTPFLLKNGAGCDSILTVEILEFQAVPPTIFDLKTCTGDSIFFENKWLAAGSSNAFVFQNLNGCDSLVVVKVAALLTSKNEIELSACAGQTVGFQGVALPAGAIDTFFFKNSAGCDSLVVVNVATLFPTTGSLKLRVCEGETVVFQGITLAGGAVQNFPFVNAVGCDSTLEVSVENWPQPQPGVFKMSACSGDSVVFQNQPLAAGSVTSFWLPNFVGCDSLVVVEVEALQPSAASLKLMACPTETVDFQGVTLSIGDSKTFVFENAVGCDSMLMVVVDGLPPLDFEVEKTSASCFNQSTGSLELGQISGVLPLEFSIDGGQNWQSSPVFESLNGGPISISARDDNGCLLKKPAQIGEISPLFIALENIVAPCDSPTIFKPLVSGGDGQPVFLWKNGAGDSLGNLQNWKMDAPGRLVFEVKNGCETRSQAVEMSWNEAEIGPIFYTPNVFSPASNSNFEWCFLLNNRAQVVDFQLLVFDRWGNQLFETDRADGCWTGDFRGKPMPPGVYVWWAKIRAMVCGERRDFYEKGDVTLVR